MASNSLPEPGSRSQSLPPVASPIEEDLSKAAVWAKRSNSNDALTPETWKGKGKGSDADDDDAASSDAGISESSVGAYPPIDDDEAETRRVQENLRRWEVAERQRRKAARESTLSTTAPSLMGDVTRRASLLWSGRKPKHTSDSDPGLGKHAALNSRESIDVPLENIATAASPIPSPTPTSAMSPFADAQAQAQNPFMASSEYLSPPTNQQGSDVVMIPSDIPPLDHNPQISSKPPPPRPLGLPPPRTPPPRIDSPPQHIAPLSATSRDGSNLQDKETRWWHEWLCGCSEGPDRGGEYQAGRTNPFE